MADFVFNTALGRVGQLARNVATASPSTSRLKVIVYNTSESDSVLRDLDTVAAIEANAATAEVTNTNYARKTLTSTNVTVTTDDSADTVSVSIPNQTWTSVGAGSAWTDVCIAYDADNGSGTDADLIPLVWLDANATPSGSNITVSFNAAGIFQAR